MFINILVNDIDVDNDILYVIVIIDVDGVVVEYVDDGVFSWMVFVGFLGVVMFNYVIVDGYGGDVMV